MSQSDCWHSRKDKRIIRTVLVPFYLLQLQILLKFKSLCGDGWSGEGLGAEHGGRGGFRVGKEDGSSPKLAEGPALVTVVRFGVGLPPLPLRWFVVNIG